MTHDTSVTVRKTINKFICWHYIFPHLLQCGGKRNDFRSVTTVTFDDVRSFAAIFQSLETCYNLKVPLQRFVSHGETIQFVHVSPHRPAVWKFNRSWGCLSLRVLVLKDTTKMSQWLQIMSLRGSLFYKFFFLDLLFLYFEIEHPLSSPPSSLHFPPSFLLKK